MDSKQIEEGLQFTPKFNAEGLIPAIAQDAGTGQVLMFAWMNREALDRTIETGRATYFSRSRRQTLDQGRAIRPFPGRPADPRRLRPGLPDSEGRRQRRPVPRRLPVLLLPGPEARQQDRPRIDRRQGLRPQGRLQEVDASEEDNGGIGILPMVHGLEAHATRIGLVCPFRTPAGTMPLWRRPDSIVPSVR